MSLSKRHIEILRLVVEAYVEDGQAVSSARVAARQRGRKLSPATLRNELSRLTDLGLLAKAHSRAGSVPTEAGLRAYLDSCLSPKLHPWDRTHLDAAARGNPTELPTHLGQALSHITGEVAIIAVPRFVGATFREVGLVRVERGMFLAYFVSPGGAVQQRMVEVDFDLSLDELQRVQNFLNDRLTHRTLGEVRDAVRRELALAVAEHDRLRRAALEIGVRALPEPELALTIEGTAQLAAKPEFHNLETLRALLNAIETKNALLRLLDHILDTPGVAVMLGSEHEVPEIAELACVGSTCTVPGGDHTATIGVLGPARMDYGRLVPLVGYAKSLFERNWSSF